MIEQLPQVIHTYQNHTLDSTRWQHYRPRPDDIVITTAYKAGTTWMQELVRQLLFVSQAVPEQDRGDLVRCRPGLTCALALSTKSLPSWKRSNIAAL